MPFAIESHGKLGKAAVEYVKALGDEASKRGGVSKSTFVWNAYKIISCAVQRGNSNIFAASLVAVTRAKGISFMPACDVPVEDVSERW